MKLIAELCQNHNGDMNIVKDMVVKAKYSGADNSINQSRFTN